MSLYVVKKNKNYIGHPTSVIEQKINIKTQNNL